MKWLFLLVFLTACGHNSCSTQSALDFSNQSNVNYDGQGAVIHTALIPAITLNLSNSANITIKNLTIIDDAEPCTPYEVCPATIEITNAKNITLDNVSIQNGRGYVVHISHSDQVSVVNSNIINAGIIGIYAGEVTTQLTISNTVITHSRTNGIALNGVIGATISSNTLSSNHYHGLFLQSNGMAFDGGQIDIPAGQNIELLENEISNGLCANCENQAVWGIELGGEGPLIGLSIHNNYFSDTYGAAVYLNVNETVDATSIISTNFIKAINYMTLNGNGTQAIGDAVISNNTNYN